MRIQTVHTLDNEAQTVVIHADNKAERALLTKMLDEQIMPTLDKVFPERKDKKEDDA